MEKKILKRKIRELEFEIERLKWENIAYEEKINNLEFEIRYLNVEVNRNKRWRKNYFQYSPLKILNK